MKKKTPNFTIELKYRAIYACVCHRSTNSYQINLSYDQIRWFTS